MDTHIEHDVLMGIPGWNADMTLSEIDKSSQMIGISVSVTNSVYSNLSFKSKVFTPQVLNQQGPGPDDIWAKFRGKINWCFSCLEICGHMSTPRGEVNCVNKCWDLGYCRD